MARPRKTMFAVVALSIDGASRALQVPRRVIADAIKSAALPAYTGPGKRIRITVGDLVSWVETWPRATTQRRKSQ